jgi:hypothetical protein
VSTGFGNFRFQGPMPSFQFCKMRFNGHIGLQRGGGRSSSGYNLEPTTRPAVCHTCMLSRACSATEKLYVTNFREVLPFQHIFTVR